MQLPCSLRACSGCWSTQSGELTASIAAGVACCTSEGEALHCSIHAFVLLLVRGVSVLLTLLLVWRSPACCLAGTAVTKRKLPLRACRCQRQQRWSAQQQRGRLWQRCVGSMPECNVRFTQLRSAKPIATAME